MEYVLMAAALLILIISVANGYWRGFIRTALGMAAMILCLVFVYLFGPTVSGLLRDQTSLEKNISEAVQESLRDSLELPELLPEAGKEELLKQSFLPETMMEKILERTEINEGLLQVDSFLQQAGDYVAELVVSILGRALTFLIAFLLIRILFVIGGLVGRVPGLHLINQLCGALLGGVRGLVIIWLLCFVIMLFSPTAWGQELLCAIDNNLFLSTFYHGALSFGSVLRLGLLLI